MNNLSTSHRFWSVALTINDFRLGRQRPGFVFRIVAFGLWSSDGVIQPLKIFLPSRHFSYVTFPDADYSPSKGFQHSFVPDIASDIAFNLFLPELDIGLWQPEILASLMTMPEATIHKNCRLILWQDNIRMPGSFLTCTRKRRPREKRYFRTIISGLVSFPLIAAIQRLLCSGVITSAIIQ